MMKTLNPVRCDTESYETLDKDSFMLAYSNGSDHDLVVSCQPGQM
jgi:hypothetical protein